MHVVVEHFLMGNRRNVQVVPQGNIQVQQLRHVQHVKQEHIRLEERQVVQNVLLENNILMQDKAPAEPAYSCENSENVQKRNNTGF